MPLGAGDRSRAAFTLLEILLAVALLGLLSAALVGGASYLLDSRPRTPTEIFWTAVRETRREALTGEREVRLSFDEKEKQFVADDGRAPKTYPVAGPRSLTISFLPAVASPSSARLIGGSLFESEAIPAVTFYPDGTCSPFRLQIRSTGEPTVLEIDPWTCAPALKEKQP